MKRANTRRNRKGAMPDEEIVNRGMSLLKHIAEEKKKGMDVVKDHDICYGDDEPLCENELGSRGLIKDIHFVTCPECKMKMNQVELKS